MQVYCPKNNNHKCWSDATFCTSCGTLLKRESILCQDCKRKQFPAGGENDSDIIYCAYCGSRNISKIEEN